MNYLVYDALTSNTTFTLGNKIPNIILNDKKLNKKSKKTRKITNPTKLR